MIKIILIATVSCGLLYVGYNIWKEIKEYFSNDTLDHWDI